MALPAWLGGVSAVPHLLPRASSERALHNMWVQSHLERNQEGRKKTEKLGCSSGDGEKECTLCVTD